jgi:hypothetical protein
MSVHAQGSGLMESDEFTHPGLRISRGSNGFQILLPVKAEKYRRLLHLLWLVLGAAFAAVLVAGLLGWQPVPLPPRPVLLGLLGAFLAAGSFMAYRWLWYAAGRERFIVTRDMVRIRRGILGIGRTRTFHRDQIRDIRAGRFDYRVVYPSWGRMFIGHGEGEILIETSSGRHAFGRGLEEAEARKLSALLKEEAHLRPHDRRPSEVRAV